MKRFLNTRETIVTEAIDGLLLSSGGNKLARLDGYPHIKVIVRKDWDKSKVAIVSGGGAGHEPAHAGFVGAGMLTAAVSGEIFASPSVDAVLAGILAVTGDAGCLLIVKNYTGDRLNFGLAAEKAKQMGRKVEMVIVADDIAIPDAPKPRGIAGTLFVHKVAGHLAEKGASLDVVKQAALEAAKATYSLGISLSSCTIPGQEPQRRSGEKAHRQAELGLGIHGEPGVATIEPKSVQHVVDMMVEVLDKKLPGEHKFALLINDLGAVPPIEMSVVANEVVNRFGKRVEIVFGPGPLMTSLDMNGFSLSLVELNDQRREALLSPVEPIAWIRGTKLETPTILPMPKFAHLAQFEASHNDRAAALVKAVCEELIAKESELNALDAKVGDGDTGTTFANAARSVVEKFSAKALPLNNPSQLCLAVGELLGKTMGGSSGVLMSIFFTAAGTEMAKSNSWHAAFEAGIGAVQHYGGAKAGDRTMLDAMIPAIAELKSGSLNAAADAAEKGAIATASMTKAGAGRSSYVGSTNLIGIQDPGATAISFAFAAAVKAS
ncbi:MAG: DAK2 domain-containing protein [Burkholderiaceae bacterium]|nr:MAG: DAK2 domain-containing protein [Burkholderiaceae bacterium]